MVGEVSTESLLASIVASLGGTMLGYSTLGDGIGGSVFKIRVQGAAIATCVVKLIKRYELPTFADEPANDRVYGARHDNFMPAYTLMQQHNIPLPALLDYGTTDDGTYDYLLLEYLAGVSAREYLGTDGGDNLHTAVGKCLRQLHNITRAHQGWVNAPPLKQSWRSAFISAFHSQLAEVSAKQLLPVATMAQLQTRIAAAERTFQDPSHFVLSHTDGFQGIAQEQREGWAVTGVVDIEDHQFTDARFVLAGHELAMEKENTALPHAFWDAYGKPPAGYEELRDYFKFFYLAVWLCVLGNPANSSIRAREAAFDHIRALLMAKLDA